ncbi:GUN4 domain-containing protein [Amycolatopsis sp. NPDC004625]|uniref:GUN4 domain-containing protein n=1 Tax=Amycolatopsis sp. NPDC004625 TaxID=3154670 RepID=UPI0033A0B4E2
MSLFERFVLGIDIRKYSDRPVRRHVVLQRELDRILGEAADGAGIDRGRWDRQPGGDGELAMLPPDVDLIAVVRGFVDQLDIRLADHNEDHEPEMRIRLRVAMHSDVMTAGPLGWAGPASVITARLLDSKPLRAALDENSRANLAQIISGPVYRKVVGSGLGGLRPGQFRPVRIGVKEFQDTAYVHVPGVSTPAHRPDERPPEPLRIPFPKRPEPELVPEPAPAPLAKVPEPGLDPALTDRVRQVRKLLEDDEVEHADALTTLALAESAGRGRSGWLRVSDGARLPLALLTELDAAWAETSGGAWGFRAQHGRLAGLDLAKRREFRQVCVRLGWRADQEEVSPRYPAFTRRAAAGGPFYPTLRNPERETYPEWHDEWASMIMAVHGQLRKSEW